MEKKRTWFAAKGEKSCNHDVLGFLYFPSVLDPVPRTLIRSVINPVCGCKMWESLLKHNTATDEGFRQSWFQFQKPHFNQTKIKWSAVATVTVLAIFFYSFNHGTDRLISPDLFLNKILCTLTVYTESRRVNRSKRSELFEGKEIRWRRSFYRRVISALLQYLIWGYSFDAIVLEDERKEKRFRLVVGSSAENRLWGSEGKFPMSWSHWWRSFRER